MTVPTTFRERYALGKSHRKHLRRAEHAGWQPKSRRVDPLKLLAESVRGRVPALIPIKYDRMAASPFGFFRGAVPIMASDLSLGSNSGIHTWLCGDAHISNLGAFAAADGKLVFDLNDFDESIRGPFEWDVKRMATSLILAGREAGAKKSLCRDAAHAFLSRYRISMHSFARMPVVQLAHHLVHRLHAVAPISQILEAAERATPAHSLEALTVPVADAAAGDLRTGSSEMISRIGGKQRIFKTLPPVLTRIHGALARHILDSLPTYAESLQPERQHFFAQYTPLDIAFKIVGTGSVGLRDYCIYMQGNGADDPLFLQIKEETASAYASYLGVHGEARHQGRRAVDAQRAMQFESDPFLGWTTIQGRDFLVRQLNDHKAGVEMQQLRSAGLLEYAAVCGETLARGHARAGEPAVIAGYVGTSTRFDIAIARFAEDYANQTDRDWESLLHSRRQTTKAARKETASSKTALSDAVPEKKAAGKHAGKSHRAHHKLKKKKR